MNENKDEFTPSDGWFPEVGWGDLIVIGVVVSLFLGVGLLICWGW